MRKSTKRELWAGLCLILLGIAIYAALRIAIARIPSEENIELTQSQLDNILDMEQRIRLDSIRQEEYWDSTRHSWQEKKRLRQERQRAYADSQRVWQARREQWAIEKELRHMTAAQRQAHYDSVRATYPQKLPKGTIIDANTADTTLLRRIPGIGTAYAKRIIAYREALGGFVSASQIEEIDGLPHNIHEWFAVYSTTASDANIRHININRADFKTLVHHPYLSYEQTKAIVNLRQRIGKLRGWSDLQGNPLFSDADIARLSPYFIF